MRIFRFLSRRTVFAVLTAGIVVSGLWLVTGSEAEEAVGKPLLREATHCLDLASANTEVRTGSPVEKGLAWLVAAQHENGGWGAGSHSNQALRDPHQVETDPATTAFAAMVLSLLHIIEQLNQLVAALAGSSAVKRLGQRFVLETRIGNVGSDRGQPLPLKLVLGRTHAGVGQGLRMRRRLEHAQRVR